MTKPNTPITYRDAGVDIDRGNELVERIRPLAKATHRDGVLSGVGGFGALFQVPTDRYREPVLVSGADGVGTKLKLAIELGIHNTVGIDLVAMCVNDILVLGAEPLFFLDYFATAELDNDVAEAVIAGIADVKSAPAPTGHYAAQIEELLKVVPESRLAVSSSCGCGR
nr:hypothetical protein [Gammaproteobacteria bacterium]